MRQLNNATFVIREEEVPLRSVGGTPVKRNIEITVINCYSPSDAAGEHKFDAFHHQLEEVIRDAKAYYKIVVGDFNVRLGMANES
ncbi:hypothetical protein KIN20_029578 [Parelaphostrongylus tenuis]|uniref:Endonuclease/exonuclease/phosphatase domain-containing protein n=1 Tax=Parelaphostrongylus tenuis TaxID=148309 RepID=A0AAD5WFL7_PARTN|nr:hypothetical protein KIN20_029578 [Parelaphostrongylus tenuis]